MAEYIFSGVEQKNTNIASIFFKCYWEILDEEIFINQYNKECVRTHFRINKFTVGSTESAIQQITLTDNYFFIRRDMEGGLEFPEGQNEVLYSADSVVIDALQGEVTLVENKEFYTTDVLKWPNGNMYATDFVIRFANCKISAKIGSYVSSGSFKQKNMYINPSAFVIHPEVIDAPDFNDEENPTITYPAVIPEGVSLQACISFTGDKDDVAYRNIPLLGGTYTFNLTEEERKALRQGVTTGTIKAVRFYIKSTYNGTTQQKYLTKNLSLINYKPTLNPTVKDIRPETLALTGDENVLVKYASKIEYSTGATAKKEAEIVSQSIQCGSKTVTDLYNVVIEDLESGSFVFNATDNRCIRAETVVIEKTLIDYLKPTCYQELKIELAGETGATIKLKVKGNYFNGTFGTIPNTIKLEVRYGEANGTMGAWQTLTGTPTFNSNTYELNATFTGFSYDKAYIFQSKITDKILYAESSQYTIRMLPVFDWSETDFNFNVPVKMHNETVLRHDANTKNTVLSASGGNIYIRPDGSESTSGELIIKPDGNVLFGGGVQVNSAATFNGEVGVNSATTFNSEVNLNGTVMFNGVDLNTLLPSEEVPVPADYIVETGTTAMGTNGTWYWTKWNSGKAECYGKRDFGKIDITIRKVSNIYTSATQTQDLPSGLFIEAPEFININTYADGGTSQYCWICNDAATAASTTSTGGFVIMSYNSKTTTSTTLTFNIIGRWK